MPPVPPGDNEAAPVFEMEDVLLRYVYVSNSLPSTHSFNHDAYAKDRKGNTEINPDLLTDKRTSTG